MRCCLLASAIALGLCRPALARTSAETQAYAAASANEASIPPLSGRVIDTASLLGFRRHDIASKLERLERKLGVQFVVLTMPSLGNEPIERFSLRAAERYKLGQAGRDNGLLLVAVASPKALRLEVGYGLEGVIADVVAARWLDSALARGPVDDITVLRAVDAVVQHLESNAEAVRAGRGRGIVRNVSDGLSGPMWLALLLLLVVAWVTLGYRALGKAPSRPLTASQMRALGSHKPSYKESPRGLSTLVHTLLWALLNFLPRGSRRDDDDFRGGGGRFGGGGASGRD